MIIELAYSQLGNLPIHCSKLMLSAAVRLEGIDNLQSAAMTYYAIRLIKVAPDEQY